ncbi:MAG: UdgX family uracil-DNA binding protein, partial [Ramlibacter sp.]
AAQQLAQAVKRDLHKMKAFLRFRELQDAAHPGSPLHVAWFEPAHHIVEAAAPWFARRFAQVRWAILTPGRSVRWDGHQLHFGPGADHCDAPATEAGEQLWLTCYHAVFNPAMSKPVPAEIRVPLAEKAPLAMLEIGEVETLEELKRATMECRECPLGQYATQSVTGEGSRKAALMFVGEQPGNQEDLQGHPFVGPAGQLLDRALAELGISREEVFVSNAVKHFKYELRGKRRIHKSPTQREAAACLHWLEDEIELVRPKALIALGSTAARSLMGYAVPVMSERGKWLEREDGRKVLITLHPSALLRMPTADKDDAFKAFVADLDKARKLLK